MGCKLMELKSLILLYTKMYLIFWGPFKFGGPVRSHSLHGPKDAPAFFLDVPVFHAAFAIQMLRVTRAGTILLQKVFSLRFTYSASLNFWSNFLFAEGIKSYYSYLELHANQGSKPEKIYSLQPNTEIKFCIFFLR